MIERIKSLTFLPLGKNVSITDAENMALLNICDHLLDCDPEYDPDHSKRPAPVPGMQNPRYYEINSKNIEYSTIKYLRSELKASMFFEENGGLSTARDETLKSMDNLGLDDVRVRIIVFRVGARSYCVAESWRLHMNAEPEKLDE